MSGKSLLSKLKKRHHSVDDLFDAWAWNGRYIKGKQVAVGMRQNLCLVAIADHVKPRSGPPFKVEADGDGFYVYDPDGNPIGYLQKADP